jgi:hypothetical protein
VSAEQPAERFPALFRSAGFLFRFLFCGLAWPAYAGDGPVANTKHAQDHRWYSEEDVLSDLAQCSSGAM